MARAKPDPQLAGGSYAHSLSDFRSFHDSEHRRSVDVLGVKTFILAAALVGALVTAGFPLFSTSPAQAFSAQRSLRVDRPEKGAGARVTHVRLISGLVRHRMRAVVLTDTRCNPDMNGVSHCLNRMRLADGHLILVVHDHRMMDMPCLSPGEHVLVTPR
jgi:hypothetical protein